MIKIVIEKNDGDQRLDRFLKKYFKKASLSFIYKMIRKDVKVNGKRAKEDFVLTAGDEINLYISEEDFQKMQQTQKERTEKVKKQFNVIYENHNILIVDKPFGLLVHGDGKEKKNTLANQVQDYLIAKGDYDPRQEKSFVPSPVNRLDRNTTGLVIFGKTAESLRLLNQLMRERDGIQKYYLTIVKGNLKEELHLQDNFERDEKTNTSKLTDEEGKFMETIAKPLKTRDNFTLVQVLLKTGRTHQIRLHLASAGFPIIGDAKYGDLGFNKKVFEKFKISTQLLHACKLEFSSEDAAKLEMSKRVFKAQIPNQFQQVIGKID